MNNEKLEAGLASDLNQELDAVEDANSLLIPALRQYQHNDCSGLLAGYDYNETQKIVSVLLLKLKAKKAENTVKCTHEFNSLDYCIKCGADAFTT